MTSFIIKAHESRPPAPSWLQGSESDCPFCRIIRGELPAQRVFEDEETIAILDILPLRKGHTLVIPKYHCVRLSDLPPEYAAATGKAVSRVAHALTEALQNTALNVVCNQEYAQAVPHVHYHIIPAPNFNTPSGTSNPLVVDAKLSEDKPPSMKKIHQMEFEAREELDDDEAHVLAKAILARL
ncbi:hypothetical protein Hypma_000788 [Hypsizygus marmoreus]|uniref:HIT domain-containing protein n=1 Tax=Hypsizygus marmoreus TaxID=39966 RepID=A0A369J9G1_HYPMA|nr:hypothetical protein Hypma_000788 [Hypsizygus marmoreus]